MLIFSSLEAAFREGFKVIDFDRDCDLFVVERTLLRTAESRKVCAFARPGSSVPLAARMGAVADKVSALVPRAFAWTRYPDLPPAA
jgi:hypothetical protein